MINRILNILIYFIVFFAFCRFEAWAEFADDANNSCITIDCSTDQAAYGEIVARLNRQSLDANLMQSDTGDSGKKGDQEVAYYLVLCRTDGKPVSFESWNPQYVIAGPFDCYTLFFENKKYAEDAVKGLSGMESIRYAELDSPVEPCGEETPTFHSWGAERMSFGPYLSYAGKCSEGSITVAIVDSGVFLHPMYADRIQESGYDYIDADYDATNDLYGHGTNVAGIVADCSAGFPVYLFPIRVLNASGGGSTSNVVNAIREATEKNVNIINLSLVARNISEAMDEAVIDAINSGITVVAAAGNNSMDTSQLSPAHLTYPGFLVIGAVESDDSIASYSNYGESVDLYAYGTDISCCSRSGGYTLATGTSIAAPHITGLSSLIMLSHQGISPDDVEMRIKNASEDQAEIGIPNLIHIIPSSYGFSLTELKMDLDDVIQLPIEVRPLTSMETLSFESGDEALLTIEDGSLIPKAAGTVHVTVRCLGMPDYSFCVSITADSCMFIMIPQSVKKISDEAFYGDNSIVHAVLPVGVEEIGSGAFDACENLKTIVVPSSVTAIEDNSFSNAVIFCHENSTAHDYAVEHVLPYILMK